MLPQLLLHLLGAIFLSACLWLAYRRWIRPFGTTLDRQARGCLWLVVVTLWGGFVGAPFWWADITGAFSWNLPPLAGRMLAAAGWAFVVAALFVLQHPSGGRVRLFLLLLATYLAPLVLVAPLVHLDRFDFAAPITYDFFAIAGGLTLAALWFLAHQPRIIPETRRDTAPAPPAIGAWLSLVAALAGGWGVALFVADRGPSATIWAWPGDLLTSRLIAVMLLALAVGAATSRGQADRAGMMLAVATTYGVGLLLASLWGVLIGTPIKPAYAITFGLIACGSALALRAGHHRARLAAVPAVGDQFQATAPNNRP